MRKKLFSLVLAVAMVISLFAGMTVTASAEELTPPQAVWGFEEGVYDAGSGTLYDAFDAANDPENAGEVIYVQVTGDSAEEDPYYCLEDGVAGMVLDLNDCTLTFTFLWPNNEVFCIESDCNLTVKNGTIEVTSSKRLITAIYSEGYGDLTIEDCTINVSASGDTVGVYAYGNLTVKDSAISATNTASSEVAYAIQLDSESTLYVVDSQLSAKAENAIAYGIECTYSDSEITVTGTASGKCSVSAVGGDEAYGINSWSKVSVTNAAVNVDSDTGANGIVAEGDLLPVTNCDIEVSSGDSACGIWAVTEYAVSGGSITVRGNSAATGIKSEGFDGTVEGCDISVEKYGDGFYDAFYGIHTANALTVTDGSITAINSQVEDAADAHAYAIYMETNRYEANEVTLVGAPAISGESADVMLGENMTISAADYTGGKVEIDWNCMHWDEDIIVSKVDPNYVNMFRLCGDAAEEDHLEVGKDDEGNPITDNDGNYCLVVFEGPQVDEPGETTGTTYKWSEIIAENSDAFKATLKPGDIIENDGSGVRFYVGDRHDYKSVWMDEGATWTVPEEFAIDDDYSIVSDSWTWMKKDEDYLILVKTADAKYAELIEVEVEQNENGKFTVTFEQEEGFLYIYVPQMDLYEAGQNADVFVAENLPMYIAMFAAQRQITTSVPAELAALAVSNGTFEVDSSMVGMLIKLQKDTEFEPQPNTYLQVGVAVVGSGRIARDITIADTANGTVTASADKAKELETVTLTVTPAEGYELDSLTVKDAEGNTVTVTDNKFIMPRSEVTVTATFKEAAPEEPECQHSYNYTSNGDGTHNGSATCQCGEAPAITNEACTYVNGECEKCGYADPGEGLDTYVITLDATGLKNCDAAGIMFNPQGTPIENYDYSLTVESGSTVTGRLAANTDSAVVYVIPEYPLAYQNLVVTVNGRTIERTFDLYNGFVYYIDEFTEDSTITIVGEATSREYESFDATLLQSATFDDITDGEPLPNLDAVIESAWITIKGGDMLHASHNWLLKAQWLCAPINSDVAPYEVDHAEADTSAYEYFIQITFPIIGTVFEVDEEAMTSDSIHIMNEEGVAYAVESFGFKGMEGTDNRDLLIAVVKPASGEPDTPHEHSYTYTSNNNGTHNGTCECNEDAIVNEECDYVEGKCEKCGYAESGEGPDTPDGPTVADLSGWVTVDPVNHTYTITPPQASGYEGSLGGYPTYMYEITEYRVHEGVLDEEGVAAGQNSLKGQEILTEVGKDDWRTGLATYLSGHTENRPVEGRLWEGQTLIVYTYDPDTYYEDEYGSRYYAVTGVHAVAIPTDDYIKDIKSGLVADNGVYTIEFAEGTLFYVPTGGETNSNTYNYSTGLPVISSERMEAADAEYDLDYLMDQYFEYITDYYSALAPFNGGGSIQYAPGDLDVMIARVLEARGYPATPEYIAAYRESFAPVYILEMNTDTYEKDGYFPEEKNYYYPLTGIFMDYMEETLENTRDKIRSLEGTLVQDSEDLFKVTFYPEVGKTYIVVTSTLRQAMTAQELMMNSPVGMTVLDEITVNQIAFSMGMSMSYSLPSKYTGVPAVPSSYATYQLIVGDAENSVNGVLVEGEGNRRVAAYEINTEDKFTVEEDIPYSDYYSITAGDYYPTIGYHSVAVFKPEITITDYTPSIEVEQGNIGEYDYLIVFTNVPTANYQWFRCDESGNVIEAVPEENTLRDAMSSESVSGLLLALELADSPAGTYYYVCKITAEGAEPVTSEVMTVTVVSGESETPHEHAYTYTSNEDGTHNGTCECGEDAIVNEACTYVNGECEKCGYAEPVTPPEHEHSYTYTSNNDGTHNGTCQCNEDAIVNEACTYVNGECEKCGYAEPVTPPVQPDEPDLYAVTVTIKEETGDNVYEVRDDATVTLIGMDGSEQVKTQSIGNGVYAFENVADGTYNLVIEYGEKIKTVLVTVDGANVDLGVIYLPAMTVNSKVEVSINTGVDSPVQGAVVGGLDDLADKIAEEIEPEDGVSVSVEVSMEIDAKQSDDVDPEHKESIEEIAGDQSENLTFLEIEIQQTITTKKTGEPDNEETTPINDTVSLLEIVIPFDTDDKFSFVVYRHHEGHSDGDVQALTDVPNGDGEYIEVEDGVIKMYVRYFSTYAIGYSVNSTPPVQCTVTFSDGAGNTTTVTVAEGATLTLPACSFTAPAGKQFKAWNVGGTEMNVGATITVNGDMTITAVWEDVIVVPPAVDIVIPVSSVEVEDVQNGTVLVDNQIVFAGSVVTITVTPDEGFELVELIIMDEAGNAIEWTSIGNNKYTFVAPEGEVTVNAIFREVDTKCPQDETCPICNYTDASATEWYHDGVHFCIEEGLMKGIAADLFAPNMATTRAQIVTILWRLEGSPMVEAAEGFDDVPESAWYYDAIRWASASEVVEGYGNGNFGPNDAITREQLAAILWRYCKYKGYDVSVGEYTNILSYADVSSVSSWAVEAMQWACGSGMIQGIEKDNEMYLDPKGDAIRSQSATMIYRFCMEVMN